MSIILYGIVNIICFLLCLFALKVFVNLMTKCFKFDDKIKNVGMSFLEWRKWTF